MPILLGYIYIQGETKKKNALFYSEISILNYFPLQKILYKRVFIDGKVPLVLGWLVCLWMSSFIYKYLVIRPITIAPLYAYIF